MVHSTTDASVLHMSPIRIEGSAYFLLKAEGSVRRVRLIFIHHARRSRSNNVNYKMRYSMSIINRM